MVIDGIQIRYFKGPSYERAGRRTSPRANGNPSRLRSSDNIGYDAEITGKTHLANDTEFKFQPLRILVADFGGTEAQLQPLPCQFLQITIQRFPLRNGKVGQMVCAELKGYIAAIGNFLGIEERVRKLCTKKPPHLLTGSEIIIITGKTIAVDIVHVSIRLHTKQDIVPRGVCLLHIVGIIRRNQREIMIAAHFNQGLIHQSLFFDRIMLQFQVKILSAQNISV